MGRILYIFRVRTTNHLLRDPRSPASAAQVTTCLRTLTRGEAASQREKYGCSGHADHLVTHAVVKRESLDPPAADLLEGVGEVT
jgi:hypothetical protein